MNAVIKMQNRAKLYADLAREFRDGGDHENAIDAQNESAALYAEARNTLAILMQVR